MKKNLLILCIIALLVADLPALAQSERTISGVVTGFKSIPLNKVTIVNQKTGKETTSDANGQFSIGCEPKELLVFRAGGFRTKKLKTGTDQLYQVDLVYVMSPASFTAATMGNHISADALQKAIDIESQKSIRDFSKYTSIWALVQSEINEVRVTGTNVYNKKVKSLDLNPQVLYVVNEKIVPDISYINPTYVKSIEFIDDVGASLYGVQGGNGVLKITLK